MTKFVPLALAAALLSACGSGAGGWHAHDLSGLMPELAYTLTDETGARVHAGQYAGKLRLLFFGYTSCPDICPVTLGRLSRAVAMLAPRQRKQVRILFVSVDPRRDSPARLRRYTDAFGPRVVGLTGSREQLRALTRRYRTTFGYGKPSDEGFYLVSHSSGVFVFGPAGRPRLLIGQDLSAQQIAADLARLLQGPRAQAMEKPS